jgi:hypothetical protein
MSIPIQSTWRKLLSFSAILLAMISVVKAESIAEPLNVIVSELTLTRPVTWKWQAPTNASVTTEFVVPGAGDNGSARVLFYVSGQNVETLSKAWKGWIRESDQPGNAQEEQIKIGKREVYFLALHGTFLKSRRPQPDWGLVGMVLPVKNQFIRVQMEGPWAVVEKAKDDLKKMITDALKEKEG